MLGIPVQDVSHLDLDFALGDWADEPHAVGFCIKRHVQALEQLAVAAKASAKREQDLRELIDKAQQEAGGIIVSLMAYKTDYLAAEEDLRVIENTARQKNCVTPNSWQSNSVIR